MTKSPQKNVLDVGIELGAACMPSELASDRATAPSLPDVRYLSEVLYCTITTHITDLDLKVTDFEILSQSVWLKFLEVYIFWSFSWILLIRHWSKI